MDTYKNCTLITDMITPITDSGNPVKKNDYYLYLCYSSNTYVYG